MLSSVYRDRSMRTVTNLVLSSLCAGDLFRATVCLPATVAWDVTETWALGEVACKVMQFAQNAALTASALTLTYVAHNR